MNHETITANLAKLQDLIIAAESRYGRAPGSVTLLAVSKKHSLESIKTAFQAGQTRFGENYLQEALAKIQMLGEFPIEWHFIGHIQTNKTLDIAKHFSWVQSIDREKIARRLSEQRPKTKNPLNILIQVNIDEESSKAGVTLLELQNLAHAIRDLPNIKLRGLMAIPAYQKSFNEQRKTFRKLCQAYEKLQQQDFALDTLSMGMSYDFEAAIAEGTTMIRIGTGLFGSRR